MIRLGSYALIVAIGAVMLWRALAAVRAHRAIQADEHAHHHQQDGHAHGACAACAAATASRGGGWVAAAVGVVPRTGALVVMLFGLANDLVIPAVMMLAAILAGMALAMSAIGVTAVLGRNCAVAGVATNPERRFRFESGARIAGAACVLLIAATLFAATLAQTPALRDRKQAAFATPLQTASQAVAN